MKGIVRRSAIMLAAGVWLVAALALVDGAAAHATPPEHVVICHAAGREGTTQYVTLDLPVVAVYGQAGHFNENGTPQAGHEQDYIGACIEEVTTSTTTSTTLPTTTTVPRTSTTRPTTVTSPPTTAGLSPSPTTTPTQSLTGGPTPTRSLAFTGSSTPYLLGLAGLFLIAGLFMVFSVRSHRKELFK